MLGHLLFNAETCILLKNTSFSDFQSSPTSLDAALVTLLGYACDVICNVIITSKDVAYMNECGSHSTM